MAVQFAGSRSLDERRRRRLASENDDPVSISELNSGTSNVRKNDSPIPAHAKKEKWRPPTPVHSLIPPRHWVVYLMVTALFLGWASLLNTAFQWETQSISLSKDFVRLFQFRDGILWNILPGGLLILTAQVSWIIYWFRRRCPSDYSGQYKIWFWAASVWMIVGVITLSGLQESMRQTLIQTFHIQSAGLGPWLWLAPLSALVLEIVRGLDIEMGRCRSSWSLLGTALIASVLFAAQLTGWQPFLEPASNTTFLFAMGTLIPTALFASTLLHAWHVLYVSDEPEPERDSELILGIRKLIFLSGCGVLFLLQKTKQLAAYPFRGLVLKPEIVTKNQADKKKKGTTENKTEKKEPAEKKKRVWFSWLSSLTKNKSKKPKLKLKLKKKKRPIPSQVSNSVEPDEESTLANYRKKNKKPRIRLQSAQSNPEPEEEFNREPGPLQSRMKKKTQQRVDPPETDDSPKSLDPALLKGLSKSERRKLRKDFRDAQRAAKRQ